MNAEAVAARSAIESLRSGVPSRHAVTQLGTTQDEVKARFDAGTGGPCGGAGRVADRGVGDVRRGQVASAQLSAVACRRSRVSSPVSWSSAPKCRWGTRLSCCGPLPKRRRLPDSADTALRALAANLQTSGTEFADLKSWTREAGLDDRFRALLHIYQEFRADEELRAQILDDFEGKFLPKAVVRQKLKEFGALVSYDLSGPRNALVAHDRIRLLARFYRAGGGKGLVVLFDELERIAKFSVKQRLNAYQELGWWSDMAQQEGSAIFPVFTMTGGFLAESITGGTRDEQRFLAGVSGRTVGTGRTSAICAPCAASLC